MIMYPIVMQPFLTRLSHPSYFSFPVNLEMRASQGEGTVPRTSRAKKELLKTSKERRPSNRACLDPTKPGRVRKPKNAAATRGTTELTYDHVHAGQSIGPLLAPKPQPEPS